MNFWCQVKAKLNQNQYYYDGNNVIQEREIYQGATVSNTYYHNLPSSLNRVISIRKGGIDYWYHTDPIGNVLFISDSAGSIIATYAQEAFGNIISSTGYADNDLHLHERGQEDGYIDLYYFGARWYDPELGRWLSPEPLGLDGPNLYQFVWNKPLLCFDDNGLYADNVHYDMTYRLAKEVGFSPIESHQLASYDQGVDDNTSCTTPYGLFFNWKLHFDNGEHARKMLCEAIRKKDWEAFGKALHTFQDTYSHAGYSWPLGHAFDNLIGFSPDRYQPVYYSRDREMTEETRRYLNLFLNKTRNNVLN